MRGTQATSGTGVQALELKPGAYEIQGKRYEADYGTLTVPENREKPDSRLIHLPVIRLRSTGESPVEPVFRLGGGPGEPNVFAPDALVELGYKDVPFAWMLEHHDLVMVGYRGVDGSVLDDPQVSEAFKVKENPLSSENLVRLGQAFSGAFRRLERGGIDVDAYNMAEVLGDIETARVGLGCDKINLFSASYGTRLAYLYGLTYPENVHRSVMYGVNPPGRFVWEPEILDSQLNHYANLWKNDPLCASRSPDLVKTIQNVIDRLPRTWHGLRIDPDKVRIMTFIQLYSTSTAAMLFDAFVAAERGDYSGLAYLSIVYDEGLASSANWCEKASKGISADYDPDRDYEAEMDPPGSIIGSPLSKLLFGGLKHGGWPIKRIPERYRKLQHSDVRTLLISGNLDVATPAEHARNDLLPFLPNGKQVILAEMGHTDVTQVQPEPFQHLVQTFLSRGTVDDSKFRYEPVNFVPAQTFQEMAKGLLGED